MEKMAKSTGNNILPREILLVKIILFYKAFSASVAIFHVTSTPEVLDFSDDAIVAAEKRYKRLKQCIH
jgi:cysteinyl-tRNA synthetase